MGLTLTYDSVLSRIRLAATALGATATYANVWRSTNNFTTFTTVRGGSQAQISGGSGVLNIDDYEFEPGIPIAYQVTSYNAGGVQQASFTAGITQDLDVVWVKVPAIPYLNQPVVVADRSEITRRSRAALFDVKGRSFPVAVGDIASSQAFTLELITNTPAEERDMDYLFASGEVIFLQKPLGVEHFPGGYFSVGDVSRETTLRASPRRVWTVPLTEVAAPGPDVIGSSYTWTSVVNQYASWTALMAANATWTALLNRTGTPSDVIVP